jgi:hypothetical protein
MYLDDRPLINSGNRSIIVEYLRNKFGPDVGLAVIYCNYKEAISQTPVNLMASLWRQLVLGRPISNKVKELYTRHREPGTRPSIGEVMEVLQSEISGYTASNVFVVVDALDECPEDNNIRQAFLAGLCAILPHIHLLVTSRQHVAGGPDFPRCIQLNIRASDEDVRRYVEGRIADDRRLARLIQRHISLQNEIWITVVGKAEGMYVLPLLIVPVNTS